MRRHSVSGTPPSWDALYEVAATQAGYLTSADVAKAGFSLPLLHHHITRGRVERSGRGIFRLVHFPPTENEDLVVVWLWSDRKGVFSHDTALLLHGLSDVLPAQKHLTVPTTWARRRLRVPPGVVLHHADLDPGDIVWKGPIPVTSIRCSLLDCSAAHLTPELLRQAVQDALERGLCQPQEIQTLMAELGMKRPRARRRAA
jgi:predicted transcriptional regulator of viral defense system